VVTDLDLPMMDGFEFCEWLNEQNGMQECCVIAMTSSNSSADQNRATEVGFDRFLVKFNSQELVSTLDEYFARTKHNAGVNA